MRKSVILTGAVAILGLGACGDELSVPNQGGPDVARVYATAAGVEAAVGGFGTQVFNPQKNSDNVGQQAKIMAEETFSSVANFGNAARDANRTFITNEIGNDNAGSNSANFFEFQRLSRSILNALHAFKLIEDDGLNTLDAGATNRLRAFAYFVLGQTYANISFMYDSGAVADESINTLDIPELVGSAEVHAAALVAYDSAITIATRGMTALPSTWISGNSPDQAEFIRIVRSYRARARAGHARTEAARDALDWAAIRDDAINGITADLVMSVRGTTGLGIVLGQMYTTGGWHQFPMRYIGMADSSGAYQTWAASNDKRAFLVRTLDERWPAGNTRAAQQTASTPVANSIAPMYIRNRPTGDDVTIARPGESQYDHRRFLNTALSSVAGPYTEMSKTEIDMLAAEAYLRLGQPALAEPLIDISRMRNGLPSVVGVGAGVVPGGVACVPKLPSGACGDLFEAMKYEKRMETAFTGYAQFFMDARGWGDLLPLTIIEWPVPYQEMQYRGHPFYDGTNQAPATNTYGFTN